MTLRYKFVLPINLILVLILAASLAWEWRRQEATGLALLRARLDEEARFVEAAYRSFGTSGRFGPFLHAFCHASDASASPEHQVAVVDAGGRVVASAAEHARRPMDPARLAGLGDGFWTRRIGDDSFLIRVVAAGPRRVVVAESTRAVRDHVRANLRSQVGWFLGAGVLLLGAVNVVMRHAVLRPIRRISRAVRALERGRLGVEVASPNGDELGALARQFNAMSRALAERAEAERREMEVARLVQAHLLPPPSWSWAASASPGAACRPAPSAATSMTSGRSRATGSRCSWPTSPATTSPRRCTWRWSGRSSGARRTRRPGRVRCWRG